MSHEEDSRLNFFTRKKPQQTYTQLNDEGVLIHTAVYLCGASGYRFHSNANGIRKK